MRLLAGALAPLAAAALGLAGCRGAPRPGSEMPRFISVEEALSRPPSLVRPGWRVWEAGTTALGVVRYAEISDEVPLSYAPEAPAVLFVLSGRAEARVQLERRLLGPGACLQLPPGSSFSLRRAGGERLLIAWISAPGQRLFSAILQAPLTLKP